MEGAEVRIRLYTLPTAGKQPPLILKTAIGVERTEKNEKHSRLIAGISAKK